MLKSAIVLENDIADVNIVRVISENKGCAIVLVLLSDLQILFPIDILDAVERRFRDGLWVNSVYESNRPFRQPHPQSHYPGCKCVLL